MKEFLLTVLSATPFAGRPLFPIVVPSGIPTPHGLLPRLLENPGREWHQLNHRLSAVVSSPTLWLPVTGVALLAAAVVVLRLTRQRELAHGGRLIRLLAPPTVDPAGALTFWNNLIPLLRPAFKRSLFGQPHLSFEISADAGGLSFAIWTPDAVPPEMVEQAVEAAWPGARTTTEPATSPLPTSAATGGRLRLGRPDALPLKTDHAADPLRPLLGALSGIEENQAVCIQLLARPVTGRRLAGLRTATKRRRAVAQSAPGTPAPAPDPFRASELAGMVTKAASPAYAVELRYAAATLTPAADKATAKWEAKVRRGQAHAVASAFASYTGLNGLVRRPLPKPVSQLAGRRIGRGQLMSVAEVAAVAHLPLDATVPGLTRAGARSVTAAAAIPTVHGDPGRDLDGYFNDTSDDFPPVTDSITFPSGLLTSPVGKTGSLPTARDGDSGSSPAGPLTSTAGISGSLPPARDDDSGAFRAVPLTSADGSPAEPVRPPVAAGKLLGLTTRGRRVMLPVADGRHHFHVLGATGSGKSTLLTNLILDDIAAGRGVAVIDPKGDLITDLLDRIPLGAAGRLMLLDPANAGDGRPFTVALNPLAGSDPQLAVDHLVGIFHRIFAAFWGPRTDDLMRSACLTLLVYAGRHGQTANLAELPQLLTDPTFRARITADLDDPAGLGGFWSTYENLGDGGRSQMIGPLLNKLRAFLLRDFVRAAVSASPTGDTQSPAAKVLAGGILLARLPKGLLGDDTSRLLGSFLVAQIWQAATHQSQHGQTARRDASLYVDECHNFLTLPHSFDDVLAEARGYHLSLILAHQHLGQLPTELRAALSSNARNKIYFSVSPEDAHQLERHTLPELGGYDLAHSTGFTAAARLVVDGNNTPAFTLQTRPAPPAIAGRADALRAAVAGPDRGNRRRPVSLSGRPPDAASVPTPGIQSGVQSGVRSGIHSGIRLSSDPDRAAEPAARRPVQGSDAPADSCGEW